MTELDLSHLSQALVEIFNKYPAGDHCEKCAEELAQILHRAGYEVAIVTLQNEEIPGTIGLRPPFIEALKPNGEHFLLGQTGFHIACRLSSDQPYHYLDALVYMHLGTKAINQLSYFNLFVYPDGIEVTNVQEVS